MAPYTTFITLTDPNYPILTYATGINNNGQIVGYYGNPGGAIGQSTDSGHRRQLHQPHSPW